ncbi:c-type cytochrome [Labrys okinawensis]|uniref:c-type cytochrome n=1 Tax=Labrys okinawensis TaxID=346911 RepID=UPI0039BCCC79
MNRVIWFGLAAASAGIAAGVVIAIQSQQWSAAPPDVPVVVNTRPPDATFDPVFEPCAHCHQIGRGARMATGPVLEGLIGRKAGTLAGYPFSDAMRNSGLTWDETTLDRFIASPQSAVPGTRMVYAGMDDPRQRKAVIDFIAKVGDGG